MGDELGSATDIDRLFVSSGRSTLVFALVGNDDFWSCHVLDFRAKYRQKKGSFEFFFDISARSSRIPTPFGPAQKKRKRATAKCFQFSSHDLQWFASFDFRKLYPLFGWPGS